MTHVVAVNEVIGFRGRHDDGSETGASWLGPKDTDFGMVLDKNFRLRLVVAETAGGSTKTPDIHFQYRHIEGDNTWTDITITSSAVRAFSSTHYAEADTTTQQVGTGNFLSNNAGMNEDGESIITGDLDVGTEEVEVETCIQMRSAVINQGDTVEFRATIDAIAPAGTPVLPTVTVGLSRNVTCTTEVIEVDGTNYPATITLIVARDVICTTAAIELSFPGFSGTEITTHNLTGQTFTTSNYTNPENANDGSILTYANDASNSVGRWTGTNIPLTGDEVVAVRGRWYLSTDDPTFDRAEMFWLEDIGNYGEAFDMPTIGNPVKIGTTTPEWTDWWPINPQPHNDGTDEIPFPRAKLNAYLGTIITGSIPSTENRLYTVEYETTTGQRFSGYFNATPTDVDGVWADEADAADGSLSTGASSNSPSTTNDWTENVLEFDGNNVGPVSGEIFGVAVRVYLSLTSGQTLRWGIFSGADEDLMGSTPGYIQGTGNLTGYSQWVTPYAPAGGWSQAEIDNLVVKVYPPIGTTDTLEIRKVEITALCEAIDGRGALVEITSHRTVTCSSAGITITPEDSVVTADSSRVVSPDNYPFRNGLLVWFDFEEEEGNGDNTGGERYDSHDSGLVLNELGYETDDPGVVTRAVNDLHEDLGFNARFTDEIEQNYLGLTEAEVTGSVLDFTGHSPFTISVRARRNTTNIRDRGIFGVGSSPWGQYGVQWGYTLDNENIIFGIDEETSGKTYIRWDGPAQAIDTWYHIIVWYDPSIDQIGLSVDDHHDKTGTAGELGLDQIDDLFCIGRSNRSNDNSGMGGDVDQFVAWDRVLSAAERTAMQTQYKYPQMVVGIQVIANPATITIGRTIACTTEVIEVDGTNHPATIERAFSVPRNVVCTTEVIEVDGSNHPATITNDRGVTAATVLITVENSTGAVVDTTYVDGGTTVNDPLGDWINEAQAVDGNVVTGSTNVTGQAPGDIGPLELTGLAVIPSTTKKLRKVQARIHGIADGTLGTTYSVETKIFSAGELLDTITLTDQATRAWSTPLSLLDKPSGGWNWVKLANLNFEVRALGTGGAPEPAVSINVIEVETTYGTGQPPIVNVPLNVVCASAGVLVTANLSDVNPSRAVSCQTIEIHVVGTTQPATINRTRGVVCEVEVIVLTEIPAAINTTRFPIADSAIITLLENAAQINTERIVLGEIEVVTLTPNAANIKTDRNVNCLPESILITGTLSTVSAGRLVAGATSVITLTENDASLNISRAVNCIPAAILVNGEDALIGIGARLDVICTTEAINVDGSNHPATVNLSRNVLCATEVIEVDGTNYPAVIAFPRVVTGITEVINVDGSNHPATLGTSRIVACATEVIVLTSDPASINRTREATPLTEVVTLVGNAAIVNTNRNVDCATEIITFTKAPATVTTGFNRPVAGLTEVINVGTDDAQINRSRSPLANPESILVTGSLSSIERSRIATGSTESILVTEGTAAVNLSRIVSCTTEEINLITNLAPLSTDRTVTCTKELISIIGITATIDKTAGSLRRVIVVS